MSPRDVSPFFSSVGCTISDILFAVRRPFLSVSFFLAVIGFSLIAAEAPRSVGGVQAQSQSSSQEPAQQQSAPQPPATQQAAPTQAPAPARVGPAIVLDPAHGGTDSGARGNGILEKDLVLEFARIVRAEFERQGFRVVMTRNDDSNPSYDDRAAIANAHRDALFITIHVSSTGALGTARAYYYQFATPIPDAASLPAASGGNLPGAPPAPSPGGLLLWEEAQRPYLDASHRFSDMMQAELAQRFAGSPTTASPAAVRELRSIAEPAVGVEISSVVTSDPVALRQFAGPLAASISKGVAVYRAANSMGGK